MIPERIVEDFVAGYQDGREVAAEDPRFEAIMELDHLAHEEPEVGWQRHNRGKEQGRAGQDR